MTSKNNMRRILVASVLGTTIEFYDFLVYGTASILVFGEIFFSSLSPWAATFAALATHAVGFVARPIGGALFGHFGDRRGRKNMLSASMLLMGFGTFLIGLLPTYGQAGALGALLLVALRFAQGIGVGGEWGGAVLMVIESTPARRGFLGAFVQIGFSLGVLLATLAFLALQAMPHAALVAWGWRMRFLASVLLFPIGAFVRSKLDETESYSAVCRFRQVARAPLLEVLRRDWRRCCTGIALKLSEVSWVFILTIYSLASVRAQGNVPVGAVLYGVALGTLLETLTLPAVGSVSDRLGRRPVLIAGAILSMAITYPVLAVLRSANPFAVAVTLAFALNVGHGIMFAVEAAAIPEQFAARIRYSGASITYQIASAIGGGGAPLVATALQATHPDPTFALTVFLGSIGAVSLVAALMIEETAFLPLKAGLISQASRSANGGAGAEAVVPVQEEGESIFGR